MGSPHIIFFFSVNLDLGAAILSRKPILNSWRPLVSLSCTASYESIFALTDYEPTPPLFPCQQAHLQIQWFMGQRDW